MLEHGSALSRLLTDGSHIPKLTRAQLEAVLAFKAVQVPKGALKPLLVELCSKSLALPLLEKPSPLPALPAPPVVVDTAVGAGPSYEAVGSGGIPMSEAAEPVSEEDSGSEDDDL